MDDPVRLIAVLEPQANRPAKEWFYRRHWLCWPWLVCQRRRLRIAQPKDDRLFPMFFLAVRFSVAHSCWRRLLADRY